MLFYHEVVITQENILLSANYIIGVKSDFLLLNPVMKWLLMFKTYKYLQIQGEISDKLCYVIWVTNLS